MNPKKMNKEQLVAKVDELQARVDNLLVQSREADELNEEKASAIDNLKDRIGELDAALVDRDEKIKEYKGKLEAALAREEELSEELQKARNQVVAIRNDAQGMEDRIADLTVSNSRLKVWKYVAVGAIIAFCVALCVIVA